MSHFYLDSSAVLKRYIVEIGHIWVKALTDPAIGHSIILSELSLAEVAAALAAKHRAPRGISQRQLKNGVDLFSNHCQTQYELIAAERAVIDWAVDLTQRHRLHGCDAVQLATALSANQTLKTTGLLPLTFVAADSNLLAAAHLEGLTLENPNLHP